MMVILTLGLIGLFIGYWLIGPVVVGMWHQVHMNSLRKDAGLNKKPVRVVRR